MKNATDTNIDEIQATRQELKQYFVYAALFSVAANILLLVPTVYMLQVYDRVVSSGSFSTLTMLSILMLALLLALGGFEWVRSKIMISASNLIDNNLRKRVSEATFLRALESGNTESNSLPLSDLSSLRQFLTSVGVFAVCDAPWFPIYIAVMFLFHSWFGYAGIFAGVVMLFLAFANEKLTNSNIRKANESSHSSLNHFESAMRNTEVISAMGMFKNISKRELSLTNSTLELQTKASNWNSVFTASTKTFRIAMQSALLGIGAYLALKQEISPGAMIAGSLLLGRALAPIDTLVASWKGFSIARAQYARLSTLLSEYPAQKEKMSLPAPAGNLNIERLVLIPPGSSQPVLKNVSLELNAGEVLGVVGPSASGKTSLARAMLGLWSPYSGDVRLDGVNVSTWDRNEVGPYLGYLPQDIELFNGSIAENICRFGQQNSEEIVEAAKSAGVHEMILKLANGYDTTIGNNGGILSAGQKQRIGLARALYASPKLIVLDEPNSNLDDQGEMELVTAIKKMKNKKCTVIVITHRKMVLQAVDKLLILKDGFAIEKDRHDDVVTNLNSFQKAEQRVTG